MTLISGHSTRHVRLTKVMGPVEPTEANRLIDVVLWPLRQIVTCRRRCRTTIGSVGRSNEEILSR